MEEVRAKSFTVVYNGISNVLKSPVKVSEKYDPRTPKFNFSIPNSHANELSCIWDTGATNTVISQRVVQTLNLKFIGFSDVSGVHGSERVSTYIVCVYLPNGVYFDGIVATVGDLGDVDVLIGMDIISRGDFVVTHKGGETVFSFRTPSIERIDFSQPPQKATPPLASKVGRNDPCPCGSKKKYKKCCGSI